MRPGFGFASDAASSDVSSHSSIAWRASAGGCGRLDGGMVPVRSFCTTFSHVSAPSATCSVSICCRVRPGGLEPVVVAGHAVAVEQLPAVGRTGRRLARGRRHGARRRRSRLLCGEFGGQAHRCRQDQPRVQDSDPGDALPHGLIHPGIVGVDRVKFKKEVSEAPRSQPASEPAASRGIRLAAGRGSRLRVQFRLWNRRSAAPAMPWGGHLDPLARSCAR